MHRLTLTAAAALLAAAPFATGALAQRVSLQDSFRIGSGAGVLCTAQVASSSKALADMFDRAYSVVCRDAAVPVGQLYALKARGADPVQRLAALRLEKAECSAAERQQVEGLGAVEVASCRMKELDVAYRVYQWRSRGTVYVAEGLAGYDSALRLGLRTLVADKPVAGEIAVATTEAGNPAAFARVQAGTLDPQRALAEAYRRNNAGNYAEAAEFFGSLLGGEADETSQAEALVNQALQQSNLGNHAEANALFARARGLVAGDPVRARMYRNYRAMHLLNQQRTEEALAELDRPLPRATSAAGAEIANLVIDPATAARLNAESPVTRQLASAGAGGLLPDEKVQILEGQAQHLRGTILRRQGKAEQAAAALNAALSQLASVRGGRVTSTVWMRGQLLGELGAIAEEGGNAAEAERQHLAAVALVGAYYPGSAALVNSQARLAAYYTRVGRAEPALALYRRIVDANAEAASGSPALRRTLAPYFALLAERAADPAAVADMFKASQVLLRPGV
ncbi:MAG TPA: CHAT domain-containing protein, partial [Allosphingosinicella sp.]